MNFGMLFCAIIGHSEFTTGCFGYIYCARCGVQLGDNLAGVGYNGIPIKHHPRDCKECRKIRDNWNLRTRVVSTIEEPILRILNK